MSPHKPKANLCGTVDSVEAPVTVVVPAQDIKDSDIHTERTLLSNMIHLGVREMGTVRNPCVNGVTVPLKRPLTNLWRHRARTQRNHCRVPTRPPAPGLARGRVWHRCRSAARWLRSHTAWPVGSATARARLGCRNADVWPECEHDANLLRCWRIFVCVPAASPG